MWHGALSAVDIRRRSRCSPGGDGVHAATQRAAFFVRIPRRRQHDQRHVALGRQRAGLLPKSARRVQGEDGDHREVRIGPLGLRDDAPNTNLRRQSAGRRDHSRHRLPAPVRASGVSQEDLRRRDRSELAEIELSAWDPRDRPGRRDPVRDHGEVQQQEHHVVPAGQVQDTRRAAGRGLERVHQAVGRHQGEGPGAARPRRRRLVDAHGLVRKRLRAAGRA